MTMMLSSAISLPSQTVIDYNNISPSQNILFVGNFNYSFDKEYTFNMNSGDYTGGLFSIHYLSWFNYDLYIDNTDNSFGSDIYEQIYLRVHNWTYSFDFELSGDFDGYEFDTLPRISGNFNQLLLDEYTTSNSVIYTIEELSKNFTFTYSKGNMYGSKMFYISTTNADDISGMPFYPITNNLQSSLGNCFFTTYPLSNDNSVYIDYSFFNNLTIDAMNSYNLLISDMVQDSFRENYENGYNNGYTNGYNNGYMDADNQDTTITTIFNGIFGVALLPLNMFLTMLNFEVMGINISGIVTALLTVGMVLIVLKFVTGKNVSGGDS